MEISYLGHACFRLKGKEVTVITDPYDKSVGYNLGRPTADIVTVSHDHLDHNYVPGVGGNPKVVKGPGEYEIKGVTITGIGAFHDEQGGKQRGKNTIYLIGIEELVICHLGDLGHRLAQSQVEAMERIDVLLVPVGGFCTIDAAQAAEMVSLLEPKIVVPMHFKTEVAKLDIDPVDRFLKEMGLKGAEPQPRLVVNRASLPEETQVILLDYRRG
ncbi:MAG: MBL fold metallo-hydrolase [Chloroflexota bacterium]